MTETYQQYINGDWCAAAGGGSWDVRDPASDEVVESVPFGGARDARRALDAADQAFENWRRTSPFDRAQILKMTAEILRSRLPELARVMVRESGKPLLQAQAEWGVAADLFEWFAEEGKRAEGSVPIPRFPHKRLMVLRQPIGVVGCITAWNFPAYNIARTWGAVLASGCTLVARPSEYTPLSAMELARALAEAGVPPGAFNLINGDADEMGRVLLESPACRKISFTGSLRVGRLLMERSAQTCTQLALELGGNAPVLVMPDVDVAAVARSAVGAKFRNCGQVCVAPQRFLLHERIYSEFVTAAAEHVRSLKVGCGLDEAVDVGPLINRQQQERVAALVAEALQAGARALVGGQSVGGPGWFYEPTLLVDATPDMRVFQEEIFGPVMPMVKVSSLEEAVQLGNQTNYGLAAYVWTNDLNAAAFASERLEFGMVGINDWAPWGVETPFGGWKESGFGRECGRAGLYEYLETKLIGTAAGPPPFAD